MSSDTKIEFEDNKIIIHRKQIQNELVGKLSEDDINLSKDIIKKNIDKRKQVVVVKIVRNSIMIILQNVQTDRDHMEL